MDIIESWREDTFDERCVGVGHSCDCAVGLLRRVGRELRELESASEVNGGSKGVACT
jgi:hypothetical protein